jgi:hypothetical protein
MGARGIREDVNLDHAWWMPTAIPQPQGALKISASELVLLGLSVGITDELGVTLGAMVPVLDVYSGWLTTKYRFLHAGRVSLAAHGSTLLVYQPAFVDDFGDPVAAQLDPAQTLGLTASYCFDEACRSVASGYAGTAFNFEEADDPLALFGMSAIVHISGGLKAMLEIDHGSQARRIYAHPDGILLWYGIRWSSRSFGVDLGVVSSIGDDGGETEELIPAFPWLKLAYRAM